MATTKLILSACNIIDFHWEDIVLPHLEVVARQVEKQGELSLPSFVAGFHEDAKHPNRIELILANNAGDLFSIKVGKPYLRIAVMNQYVSLHNPDHFFSLRIGEEQADIGLQVDTEEEQLLALSALTELSLTTASDSDQNPVIRVTQREFDHYRIEALHTIFGLLRGNESAVIKLYKFAQNLPEDLTTSEQTEHLTPDQAAAYTISKIITEWWSTFTPYNLVGLVSTSEETDTINAFERVFSQADIDEFDDLFLAEFADYAEEFVPTQQPDTDERSREIEYLLKPSNEVPLLCGLGTLRKQLNDDLYYAENWNRVDAEELVGITEGEVFIINTILLLQRLCMFATVMYRNEADSLDSEEFDLRCQQEVMGMLIDGAAQDSSLADDWVFKEALKFARKDPEFFQFVFCMYLDEEMIQDAVDTDNWEPVFSSPYGQLLAWFGKVIVRERWERRSLLIAFEGQPAMQEFMRTVFRLRESSVGMDDYVADAIVELLSDERPFDVLVKELGESIQILANMNAMKQLSEPEDTARFVDDYVEDIYRN